MSTFVLNIHKNQKPKEILDFLNKTQPKKGDLLKLVSLELLGTEFIILLTLALSYFKDKKEKMDNSEKFLQDLFNEFSAIEDYEKFIQNEYGITIQIEQPVKEKKEWNEFALDNLARAYSDDEPDINEIVVKEPNPNYNPKL